MVIGYKPSLMMDIVPKPGNEEQIPDENSHVLIPLA